MALNASTSYNGSQIRQQMFQAGQSYVGVTGNKTFDQQGNPMYGSFDILQVQNERIYIVGTWSSSSDLELFINFITVKTADSSPVEILIISLITFSVMVIVIIMTIIVRNRKQQTISYTDLISFAKTEQLRKIYKKISIGLRNIQSNLLTNIELPPIKTNVTSMTKLENDLL